MDDLISREVAKAAIRSKFQNVIDRCEINEVLNELPAVDAVPVVHGRWIEKKWFTECDWCVINHRVLVCAACSVEINDGEQTPYCPYCGAKMDGERRNNE